MAGAGSRRKKAVKKAARLMTGGATFNPRKISYESRMQAAQADPMHSKIYVPEEYGMEVPTSAKVEHPTQNIKWDNAATTTPHKKKK